MAAEHLLGLGHRRIACILGPANVASSVDRLTGFRAAVSGAGLDIETEPVSWGEFRVDAGYRITRALLDDRPEITAVFAANDLLAFGAIRAAYDLQRAVPSSLSVAGFDDIALAGLSLPRLTTIRQPLARLAARVMQRLSARLAGDFHTPNEITGKCPAEATPLDRCSAIFRFAPYSKVSRSVHSG
jgi:LacI family transcriptional regulator